MTHNQKLAVFLLVMAGTAVILWGPAGVFTLIPGPNPK